MKNLKKPIKKILTGVTCLVVVAAIVSLCSIAYFKETTQPENNSIRFASVRVSEDVEFQSRVPNNKNPYITYDENGYYISLYQQNSNTDTYVKYSPKVTNNGEKPIAAYIIVTFPVARTLKEDGKDYALTDIFTGFSLPPNSKWVRLRTIRSTRKDVTAIAFGYKEPLQPGETTEPLNSSFCPRKVDFDNMVAKYDVTDGYRQLRIQTSAIGIQDPVDIMYRTYVMDTRYDWNLDTWNVDDPEYGAKALLNEALSATMTSEMDYYYFENILKINDDCNDDSKLH